MGSAANVRTGPLRIATYTRISTDEDHQPYSLEAQAGRLEKYVASQDGWTLVRRFSDQKSGATLDRPELQRALREAKAGRFDLLLVYRVDRLSRSVRGLAHILEELDAVSVAFRSATEPFDTSTPAGRLMVQMLGVFAEFERATIIDRVVAGMERKAARGEWHGGQLPYGYGIDKATGFLTPNPAEAALVPQMFRLYAQHRHGSREVAWWLNKHGHRTRKGRAWSHTGILTVLRNRVYVGDLYFRGEYHRAPHPALVDEKLFEQAQALLRERGEDSSKQRGHATDYLLSGAMLVCDRCGHTYSGAAAHGRGGRYRYYVCMSQKKRGKWECDSERLPADALEEAIVDSLMRLFANPDILQRAIEQASRNAAEARPAYEDQLGQVEAEIRKAEDAIERYFAAFEAGTMPEAQCGERVRKLGEKVAELRISRNELLATIEDHPQPEGTPSTDELELLREEVAHILDPEVDAAARKVILKRFVQEIRIEGRHSILPLFKIPEDRVRLADGLVPARGVEPRLPP